MTIWWRFFNHFNFRSWNGYNDELVWAALWLHKATGESDYLTKAQDWFTEFEFEGINEVFSWDDKVAGAKILLAEATGSLNDISSVRTLCQTYVDYPRSPKGRTHFMQWGSNRYASNGAFICLKVSFISRFSFLFCSKTMVLNGSLILYSKAFTFVKSVRTKKAFALHEFMNCDEENR